MNILVIAYGCEPNRGSEAGIGWHWTQMMAEDHKVTVITRANNEGGITEYYKSHSQKNIRYVYYDPPDFIKKYKKKERGLKLFFYFWQKGVIQLVKRLLKESHYDLVWEMNFGSMTLPTYVSELKDIKFVIGPVSTKATIPTAYAKHYGKKYYLQNTLKGYIQKNLWLNHKAWKAFKQASAIVVCDDDYVKMLPQGADKKTFSVFHNGIEKTEILPKDHTEKKKLEFVFSGRNAVHKNIQLAIDAFSSVVKVNSDFHFRIFTMGDNVSALEKRVEELGLIGLVEVLDPVKQDELFRVYQKCDAFIFPSLSEISSTAVVEAMYSGLVPVCFDIPGMGCVIDSESCILIQPSEYHQDVEKFAEAILNLMNNRALLKLKQEKCLEKSHDAFLWNGRKKDIEKVISMVKNEGI